MFRKLLKSIYRYLMKNKGSFIALSILLFVSIFSFSGLTNLSRTLTSSFEKLVTEQKLHHITVNESYADDKRAINQKKFYNYLDQLKTFYLKQNKILDYSNDTSLLVNSSTSNFTYKVIDYDVTRKINTLESTLNGKLKDVGWADYDIPSLIKLSKNNLESDLVTHLNDPFNSNKVIYDLIGNNEKKDNESVNSERINARRVLLEHIFLGRWDNTEDPYYLNFKTAYGHLKANPDYDPLFPNIQGLEARTATDLIDVSRQMLLILYPNKDLIKINGETSLVIKDHRMTISFNRSGVIIPVYFDIYSSYTAVVPPEFLLTNNKKVYDINEYQTFLSRKTDQKQYENWFNDIDDQYKVYIDSTPFLILGSSITPDYMYPIISFESVIPNPKRETLVYVNHNGFSRIFDGFRSNPIEKNLQLRLSNIDGSGVSAKEIKELINNINNEVKSKSLMNWPLNFDVAFEKEDTNNRITPSPLRIIFVKKITISISTFTYIIITFISILSVFVVFIIVRRFINQNKAKIGTLIANGVNKYKIILSFSLIGLVPSVIGGVLGSIASFYSQSALLDLIKDYWQIPTNFAPFNFGYLISSIIVPFSILFIIIFVMGYFALRNSPLALMSGFKEHKPSKVAIFFKKFFPYASGINKYMITSAFGSLTKIAILGSMTALSLGLIVFLTTTRNKIDESTNLTLLSKKYKYAIELTTPSNAGGQYYAITPETIGHTINYKDKQGKEFNIDQDYRNTDYMHLVTKSLFSQYANVKFTGAKDNDIKNNNLRYIANAFQVKQFLDFSFGIKDSLSSSTNPWSITKALIPENTLQNINTFYRKWATRIVNDHTIFTDRPKENNPKKDIARKAYEILAINNIRDDSQFKTKNELEQLLERRIKNINDKELDRNRAFYKLYIRVFDEEYNVNEFTVLYSFDKQENRWKTSDIPLDFLNTLDGNSHYMGNIYIEKNDLEILQYGQDRLIDTIFKKENSNDQNVITFSSYLRHMFLTPKKDGDFVLKEPSNIFNVRLFIAHHALNNELTFIDDNQIKHQLPYDDLTDLFVTSIANNIFTVTNKKEKKTITFRKDFVQESYAIDSNRATNAKSSAFATRISDQFINLLLLSFPSSSRDYIDVWSGVLFNAVPLDYGNEKDANKNIGFDEPYIWIDSDLISVNNTPLVNPTSLKLTGIIENSRLIDLYSHSKKINSLLFDNENGIIINQNAAKKYHLVIGDQIEIIAKNTKNRYETKNNRVTKLKVIAISDTYQTPEIYISIEDARKILDLNENTSTTNTKYRQFKGAFNGILTSKKNPEILTRLTTIYSPSGLYPVSESWKKDEATLNLISNVLIYDEQIDGKIDPKDVRFGLKSSQDHLAFALGFTSFNALRASLKYDRLNIEQVKKAASQVIDRLVMKYGKDTYLSVLKNVEAVDILFAILDTANRTITKVETTVIIIILAITLMVVILLTTNSLFDILKVMALLKNLGYKDGKTAWLLITQLIPPFIIGFLLSIPIVYGVSNAFIEVIFNSLGVLVTSGIAFWHFLIIIGAIFILLLMIYLYSLYLMKKMDIANASKRY
ncbi:ABC transporter permease [Ureaplasma canigenitalium]|uniref:ABC transporter permease n=1 Tax=Ureaplasma canigenitalium TaxID=42092 RepID=UPI0004E155FE|nr:ABC transporter permease [Ureaplasma canigenitalium]